ncbi:MAG TPA: FAD-dependent oxidoreductase [Burkholderiales bacterium]|nr:FAD-dependent oxidoreductase [Burkholderiales bacterium]
MSPLGSASRSDVTQVIIVGGGPCGLMLANELGRRGIAVVLVDQKPGTAFNPQANASQARTMEHYRRLGFADEIRALGMPHDFPTDVAYFTRFAKHELARFKLPSSREAKQMISSLSGSWSAAELPHRCNQKFIEPVLRRHAEMLPSVSVNFAWRMTAWRDAGDHVEVEVEPVSGQGTQTVRGAYLVGADGARSLTRQGLGLRYTGETGVSRDFVGGRMYAVYACIPDFYREMPHPPAWMNVSFNRERRCFMPAVDGKGEFAFHTQLKPSEDEKSVSESEAAGMVQAAIGAPLKVEVLSRDTWTAGHSLVAEHFGTGRVFIGGDAAHLFTPTGGLGYNTAVEDAVNLGWKLAAVLNGQASPQLLASYGAERRPLAVRNTAYARRFADSLGLYEPAAEIEEDTPAGEAARRRAGEYLEAHGRAEFNIPGVTFGGRYDGSPAIVPDGTEPPPETANTYVPSACPGGRPPHLWLADGRSLYDCFGFEWTLLRLGSAQGEEMIRVAKIRKLDLKVVDLKAARDLYGADLALIRPDQIIAWRGNEARAAERIFGKLLGHG